MIPLLDLKAQYASLKPEIDAAVLKVLASAQYVLGDEVEQFEREFADYCGVRHAVAVNSGTSALHLTLLSLGCGPGDEVVTVPFTFVDPGVDRITGTADDQTFSTTALQSGVGTDRVFTNTDDDADFHTVEVAVNRRFAEAVHAMGDRPVREVHDDFVIYPLR